MGLPSRRSLFGENAAVLADTDYQLLLLAGLLPTLGSGIVSPVLDSLIDPFGASAATIGWMISAFTAPAIVAIPLAGVLADRYGRKVVLVTAITLFGLGGAAVAFTTDFRVALGLRFIQGAGWAGMTPTIVTSIGDLYEPPAEETAQGIRFGVTGASGAVFPLLAGLLVAVAWQYPFLLYAMSFPIALGVLLWFDEPGTGRSSDDAAERSYIRALLSLGSQPAVLAIVIARSLYPVVFIGLMTYNSVIVIRLLGGTPVQAGLLATVAYAAFALVATQTGRLVAILGSRLALLLGANASLGLGFGVVLLAPNVAIAALGAIGIGLGIGILGTLYRSLITGAAPPDLRAGLVALSEAGSRITATATPVVMGTIIGATSAGLGLGGALRLAGLVVATVAAGGGMILVLVARITGPVGTG
ncbi:MAG: MFS transporter [Salinirussus sp.]